MRSAGRPIRRPVIVGTLLGGVVLGAMSHQLLAAPPWFTETPLYRADLAGIEKHELIVSRLASPATAFKFLLIRLHVKGEPMSVELN